MSRRHQLQPLVGPLLDIYGCDTGQPIIAALQSIADVLDDNDDLIGDRLDLTAWEDQGEQPPRWHLPDVE